MGINARDTLQRKLIHMQTKPFRSIWIDLDFYQKIKIDKRYVVIKGRFFKQADKKEPSPDWLNETFPTHLWYPINNRDDYDADFLMQSKVTDLNPHLEKEELRRRRARLSRWPYVPLELEDIDTNLYLNQGEPVVLVRDRWD